MSCDHFTCLSTGSTLRPMTFALRLSNSGLRRATVPSSVVQTGVKSLGWENRTPQELPSHSWNLSRPSVVSASKSGATELMGSDIGALLVWCDARSAVRCGPLSCRASNTAAIVLDAGRGFHGRDLSSL